MLRSHTRWLGDDLELMDGMGKVFRGMRNKNLQGKGLLGKDTKSRTPIEITKNELLQQQIKGQSFKDVTQYYKR